MWNKNVCIERAIISAVEDKFEHIEDHYRYYSENGQGLGDAIIDILMELTANNTIELWNSSEEVIMKYRFFEIGIVHVSFYANNHINQLSFIYEVI